MSVIEASSVRVSTMADGTLRLVCDIEPRFANDAFALFGVPGVPMALAALKIQPLSTEPEKAKGGELCRRAVMLCKDAEFRHWLRESGDFVGDLHESGAADVIREWCQIESRSELDNNAEAEKRFRTHVLAPWAKHRSGWPQHRSAEA